MFSIDGANAYVQAMQAQRAEPSIIGPSRGLTDTAPAPEAPEQDPIAEPTMTVMAPKPLPPLFAPAAPPSTAPQAALFLSDTLRWHMSQNC
jgi:hypothetical protein